MLGGLIGLAAAVPVARRMFGSSIVTLLFVTLRLKGVLAPALYISLPWIRSYISPAPPRTTVFPLPVRSYANPMRGANVFQLLLTRLLKRDCVQEFRSRLSKAELRPEWGSGLFPALDCSG